MTAPSTILERAPVSPTARSARLPQVYGWRFPAEFRTKPLGWTERKQPTPPACPLQAAAGARDSSVGCDPVRDACLDRGPDGLAVQSARLPEQDASNASASAPLAVLAFAATPAQAGVQTPLAVSRPQLLDLGPPAGLAATRPLHESESNAGPTLLPRDLGMAPVRTRQETTAPADVLDIGEPAAWLAPARMPRQGFEEASYALS